MRPASEGNGSPGAWTIAGTKDAGEAQLSDHLMADLLKSVVSTCLLRTRGTHGIRVTAAGPAGEVTSHCPQPCGPKFVPSA